MRLIQWMFLGVLLLISVTTKAQKNIKSGNQQWFQYYNQLKISDKWSMLSDAGYRVKSNFSQQSLYIVRAGVGYKLNDDCTILVGFAHLGNFSATDKINKLEYRPYQEITLKQKQNEVAIAHRFRVEERFFKTVNNGEVLAGTLFNFRFRYRFLLNIPIANLSKTNSDCKLSLQLSDEILLNAGGDIVYNIFDQNRFLIGPAIQFNKKFTLNLNYNYQFAAANSPASYKEDQVFWLGVTHKLGLKPKKQN